jgi:MtfA peptidase
MSWRTERRRRKLREQPFPTQWLEILDRNVPLLRLVDEDRRQEFFGLVQVFIAEKNFEGAGGLEMTDEIRVTIAANACLLLLGRDADAFPLLSSIIVYPGAYLAGHDDMMEDGTVSDEPEERYGESWGHGAVVLSWEDVMFGVAHPDDGENVVLHEFAHQLDEETGDSNGVPRLESSDAREEWARLMSREYEALVDKIDHNRRVLLDEYAAESPAEFFAVATEFFFERPAQFKARYPDLYRILAAFYRLDPAARRSPALPD